jgi:hypothetical protein
VFFFFSCNKTHFSEEKEKFIDSVQNRESHEFYSGGENNEIIEDKLTILGETRINPYTVENFTEAYNELYEPDISTLQVTDYYLQFSPTTNEDVLKLAKSDLNLYDFPLDRKVIEMGEKYLDLNAPKDQINPFYAVVKPSQKLPEVNYKVIAQLHLRSNDEKLIRHALNRKGYNPDEEGYIVNKEPVFEGEGSGGSSNDLVTNPCGCLVYKNKSKPGGCVQVRDVQLQIFQGVRKVKVIMKDYWFTETETWTDDNGCFKINSEYKNHAWMWVKFNSDFLKIRGTKNDFSSTWDWAFAIKDFIGQINGPDFNDIQVKYDIWSNQGSQSHIHWGAATINNAYHESRNFSTIQGITPPPMGLDVYAGRNHAYGYTLMSAQNQISQAVGGTLLATTFFAGPFSPLIALIGAAATQAYLPDVYIGIDFSNSDALKWLAYHELAHTSHFMKVFGSSYWNNLVGAEILANGHGSSNSTASGIISLSESWAEHIGLTFSNMNYGLSNSVLGNYQTILEGVRNESLNHIPIGFYNDLIDVAPGEGLACDFGPAPTPACGVITDAVGGFTNAQMFGVFNGSIDSPLKFRNSLIIGATPATTAAVNALFLSY